MILTVDGPSGSGKSTVSRIVARRLGMPHLDTGAFYRAATLAVLRTGADPSDQDEVLDVVEDAEIDLRVGVTLLDGDDVSDAIRQEPVNKAVSAVSAHPSVRHVLVGVQRAWVDRHGGTAVVEGRDIGTVVFPEADLKVYLDARAEVRAARRASEMGEDPDEVAVDLARRDHLDSTRLSSPLAVPEDAIVIDTSDMTVEQVAETVVDLAASRS